MKKKASNLNIVIPFKLYADCLITTGFKQGVISDVTRSSYCIVPTDLCNIMHKYDGTSIEHVLGEFDKSEKETILEYFEFMLENEFIFFTESPSLFPPIDCSQLYEPQVMYQAIIDLQDDLNTVQGDLFKELDNLSCKYLQIRIYGNIEIDQLIEWLKESKGTSIIDIELYIKYQSMEQIDESISRYETIDRLNKIVYYNAPENAVLMDLKKKKRINLITVQQNIIGCKNCGVVSKDYFTINLKSYIKSMNENSCLHGKISVDTQGKIKNCPSCSASFGNIKDVTLNEAIQHPDFKKLWSIKKDDIFGCKDCEFRYICIDCRAYVEDPNNEYSKPLKCGYDPYTNKWEEWSTHPMKQKAIDHYGLRNIEKK